MIKKIFLFVCIGFVIFSKQVSAITEIKIPGVNAPPENIPVQTQPNTPIIKSEEKKECAHKKIEEGASISQVTKNLQPDYELDHHVIVNQWVLGTREFNIAFADNGNFLYIDSITGPTQPFMDTNARTAEKFTKARLSLTGFQAVLQGPGTKYDVYFFNSSGSDDVIKVRTQNGNVVSFEVPEDFDNCVRGRKSF